MEKVAPDSRPPHHGDYGSAKKSPEATEYERLTVRLSGCIRSCMTDGQGICPLAGVQLTLGLIIGIG
jgi:hypothetical protein